MRHTDDAASSAVGKDVDDTEVTTPPSRASRGWFRVLARHRTDGTLNVLDRAVMSDAAETDHEVVDDEETTAGADTPGQRLGLVFVMVVIVLQAGLCGWSAYQAFATAQVQRDDAQFLEAGKQAAVKLTSISHADADGDVKRILESATGPFAEDFQARSQPFVDMVKQVKSTTVGTVAEAGLESIDGGKARILVAVSVKTTLGAGAEQPTRLWRMRIEVQKIGNETKVANVEFVP